MKNNSVFYTDRHRKALRGVTIIVVRGTGVYKNSKPCAQCTTLLHELGVKRVIYSGDNNDFHIVRIKFLHTEHESSSQKVLSNYTRARIRRVV